MSSTLSIENATSTVEWLEGALIVIKENLAIFPASEYSKVADLVKNYLNRNEKKPEDLFNCLNNRSSKRPIDYILLGFSLEHGIGTIPNLRRAFLEFQKAANAEDSFGQFFLGYCYNYGIGTSQDRGKAFELYSKATERVINAQSNLALCYDNGWGITKNDEKAFELYSKAAEAGNINAQYGLALCYANGLGTTKNMEKAFERYSKAAEAGNTNAQCNLGGGYLYGRGIKKNEEKAFEFYLKAAEAGDSNAQFNLAVCYSNGWGTTKNEEKAFEFYSKAAEAGDLYAQIQSCILQEITKDLEKVGNLSPQTSIGMHYRNRWGTKKNRKGTFEFIKKQQWREIKMHNITLDAKAVGLYLKVAEVNNWYDFPDLDVHDLTSKNQNRGFKYSDNLKGEFLDFEAFFDQLSDEFKCLKCGNLGIIINESAICPFCDNNKSDKITFNAALPKCPECYSALKDPLWCNSCESSRFLKARETWQSCLEWISPDEILHLNKVEEGGFGIVKEGRWKRGKILFWYKKNQKYERSGITRVALKYLKNSQNIEYVNSIEFVAHLTCASCKYILECYGITKDITTNEFSLSQAEGRHSYLGHFLRILFQIAGGLRFIHDSKFVHEDLHPGNILVLKSNPLKVVIADLGFCRPANYSPQSKDIFGVVEYSAPEVCNLSPHTKCSDIYSCAIISWEMISAERPWNDVKNRMYIQLDIIQRERPKIEKCTPQCIQEMIEKNWDQNPYYRDTAEKFQQRVIAARDNYNLNELIREKRLNSQETQDVIHDTTRYTSKIISKPTFSTNGKLFIDYYSISK
ncbi:hypothetical protein G9A89_003331 [Geosiphon pyriformis]|nr:hypothetical protein G9A89_003331 [Geosiphon pyriformis]